MSLIPYSKLSYAAIPLKSILNHVFKHAIYTVPRGLAQGLRIQGEPLSAFISFIEHKADKEEMFLRSLDLKDKVVYDVGTHIGLTTIFFAHAVHSGSVFAFEPNPQSFKALKLNVAANRFQNVKPFNIGLGDKREQTVLTASKLSNATGTLNHQIRNMIAKGPCNQFIIQVHVLDNFIIDEHLPHPDFVKIDTEGSELNIIKGMIHTIQKWKPTLFIEIHTNMKSKIENLEELFKLLTMNGYTILNIESKTILSLENIHDASSHLFCYAS